MITGMWVLVICAAVLTAFVAEPALAARYEAAMRRRFPACRVTNEPVARSGAER